MSSNDLLTDNLEVDASSRSNFLVMAKWGKLLAIAGFVFTGIFILVALFAPELISKSGMNRYYGTEAAAFRVGITIGYLLMSLIFFFPSLFIYRFSVRMQAALTQNNQELFNSAVENLKSTFRFYGIVTIVIIGIYVLILFFATVGAAMM